MDAIGELVTCCKAADTDKVTERKKQIDTLKKLLYRQPVVDALDINSQAKTGDRRGLGKFTWQDVFKAVRNIVLKEAECLRKAKIPQSQTSKSNREKKKQDVSSLFKVAVRQANSNGHHLRIQPVLDHIIAVMEDSFTRAAFGVDYSSVLLKDVLAVRKYWCEVSSEQWHSLLAIFCQTFKDPSSNLDRAGLARTIHILLEGASQQQDIRAKRFTEFFLDTLKNVKQEKNMSVVEHLLCGMNALCRAVAIDCRTQVCRLGEGIAKGLFFIWHSRPSEPLKEELVEFFRLQMAVHHPEGASTEEQGAFSLDWDLWKSHMRKLYEAMYHDLQQIGGRNKFVSGSKDVVLKPAYVDLAADVCHQIFLEKLPSIDVTQMSFYEQPGGMAKRRKVESGWGVLRDFITTLGQTSQAIPWLQLLSVMLRKYPHSLPEEELLPMLSSLQQLQAECKRGEVTGWVLTALVSLANAQGESKDSPSQQATNESARSHWSQVWRSALRLISLHHAVEEGFQLLTVLLQRGLTQPGKDIWTLFIPNMYSCTTSAVEFLAAYLINHDLPENFQPNVLNVSSIPITEIDRFPLRQQLLNWMLPNYDELGENNAVPVIGSIDLELLSHVLVALSLRNYGGATYRNVETPAQQYLTRKEKITSRLHSIQSSYLHSSFDIQAQHSRSSSSELPKAATTSLRPIHQKLLQLLIRDSKQLIEAGEAEAKSVERMASQLGLIALVLEKMLLAGTLTIAQLKDAELLNIWKDMMKKFASDFCETVKKDGATSTACVLPRLLNLYSHSGRRNNESTQVIGELFRALSPANLMEQLMVVARQKVSKSRSASRHEPQASSSRGHRRNSSPVFDEFDMEFDDRNSRSSFEESELAESQGTEDVEQSKACESLLSPLSLSDAQKVRLQSVEVLCCWCACDSLEAAHTIGVPSEVQASTIKSKLLELLNTDNIDLSRPVDVQLAKVIIEHFIAEGQELDEDDLGTVVDTFSHVFKTLRRDQDVSVAFLGLLSRLVPHLLVDSAMVDASKAECRDIVLHLLGAFWRLQKDFSSAVRMAILECMTSFIKYDPEGEWAVFKQRARHNSGDDDPAEQPLVEEFPDLLKDKSHAIRLQAARDVRYLFERSSGSCATPLHRIRQDSNFDKIYNTLLEVMVVEGRLSLDEQRDEAVNRTSIVLHTLRSIASSSAVCEKKAICSFCLMIKESNIEVTLVKKVLLQLSHALNYSSLLQLMASHLPYLVKQWLDLHYSIAEIPYQLWQSSSQVEFYREHYETIVPSVVMHKDQASLELMSRELRIDWKDLLVECIPKIIIHIIPLFATSKMTGGQAGSDEVKSQIRYANSCYSFLTNKVNQELIDQSIAAHIEEIVVDVLMTLYDPYTEEGQLTDTARESDPEPNPPFFNTETVTATLDYLTKCHAANAKSLVALLAKSMDGIQKVLLALSVRLSGAPHSHGKRRVLLMYSLFVKLLLREFHEKLGGSWAFVLRDIVHTLTNHIHNALRQYRLVSSFAGEDIVCMCCDILYAVCQVTVEVCAEELGKYLPLIISSLIPLVDIGGSIGTQSQRLLKFLILDNSVSLGSSIALLDPFPDTETFPAYRTVHQEYKYRTGQFSLKQEVAHFLSVRKHCMSSATTGLEGLRFLKDQLSQRKDQLAALVAECEEFQGESLLVRLMQELVHLCQCGQGDVVQAAAGCLGEIGPVDLSVVALSSSSSREETPALQEACRVYKDNSKMQQYCYIFHLLSHYLVDPCVDTVVAASDVLKKLLATKTGITFYKGYKEQVQDYLFHYLHPFKAGKSKAGGQGGGSSSSDQFMSTVNSQLLWCPRHNDHTAWLKELVCALIDSGAVKDQLLQLLTPICQVKVKFCEVIVPFLIHDILEGGEPAYHQVLSQQISDFFSSHCGIVDRASSRTTTPLPFQDAEDISVCSNQESVRVMLSVVQYLRLQERPKQGRKVMTAWENNFWLDVDYLQVAKAAQNCGAYFTTLSYTEIWSDTHKVLSSSSGRSSSRRESQGSRSSSQSQGSSHSQSNQLDVLSILSANSDINVQNLLLEAYRCIGDPDGVYGCGAGRLSDSAARIRTYEHEDQWDKAVGSYDLEMAQPIAATQVGLLQALQNFGAGHVLSVYLQGISSQGLEQAREVQEFQYEAAWRSANWNLDMPTRLSEDLGYQQSLYSTLRALRDQDDILSATMLDATRCAALRCVDTSTVESARSIYPALAQLHAVIQLEDTRNLLLRSSCDVDSMLEKWEGQDKVVENDYEFTEAFMQQRCTLLQLVLPSRRREESEIHAGLLSQLEAVSRMARQAQRHVIAERALFQLKQLDGSSCGSWRIEEARLFWARKEHNTAQHLLKLLLDKLETQQEGSMEAARLYPRALGIYGDWLAETKSEDPSVIMEKYLNKAVVLLENLEQQDTVALDAYLSLARFADSQYKTKVNYMNSTAYESKQNLIEKAKQDLTKLQSMKEQTTDMKRYKRMLEQQRLIDEKELANVMVDRKKFLLQAVHNYIKCLQYGDKHDLRVFRLTALWFDNAASVEVNQLIESGLASIKLYKFLPLMYQLAARMSTRPQHCKLFQPTLDKLIAQACVAHPHHTLFIVLALAHANKDKDCVPNKSRKAAGRLSRGGANQEAEGSEEDRVSAAKKMVQLLRKTERRELIQEMERLCMAYIQLANWDVTQYKKETKPITLPGGLLLTQLKELHNIAVPTLEQKVDPSEQYTNLVTISSFKPQFSLAGGVNLPKIIGCLGSDGKARRQLVKGKDDLRQDAVMQQVFSMVNNLLHKDAPTRKRKLKVRTYKVVPLSQRSGLLEWCEGTMPLGQYLIFANGAHGRYRPNDYSAMQCRAKLTEAPATDVQKRYKAYMDVCKNFQPVFRHFFMEKFPHPARWYEKRLAYTRSVATNSIVGYILGLGDRHVQNILVDCNTAELVHIDLGVAFEQGKVLPTPETVPFRLTRDIVDGMGVAGVEGVFRRCCEKMMEVMHGNQEALLTILQVLLYDPLYAWTLSPLKAYNLQHKADPDISQLNATTGKVILDDEEEDSDEEDGSRQKDNSTQAPQAGEPSTSTTYPAQGLSNTPLHEFDFLGDDENVNKMAARVLLRLEQKLQGIEDGVQLSVSGQVNHLIQEAKDPKNLCRLFPGWQPYI